MKKVKFIHNVSGSEIECSCESIKVDYIDEKMTYICKVKQDGDEDKTVGAFSFSHFSMCASENYIKEKMSKPNNYILVGVGKIKGI